MTDLILADVERILADPGYRREPLPASYCAELLGVSKAAVSNLAARPHTGVRRYPRGYDIWELHRWLLIRNESRVRSKRVA